ncbi:uncharacterized protein LOC117790946 [Drosophila innubila]|uniref:uncharacterized protein LOC117790946 n=1 Tax=Drosophila innubila TaxID=198719 RepID=UPI00148CDC33|nr:uncharacterized protein LOC117790946 [Drosophila innubila]
MMISRRGNLLFFWFVLNISFLHNVKANCAPNGAYCQTHYECCSRKCMTYSYICAPVVSPVVFRAPQQHNYVPANWWTINNNRLFEEQIDIATLPDDKSNTGTHAVEKVDTSVMTNNFPQVFEVESRTCKPVGKECSDSSECCSMRCHTYLHRCVT